MIQILFGDEAHRARGQALAGTIPGASVASASGPAFDKKVMKIHTLIFWGHGDAHKFCGMTATGFIDKVKEWKKWNPTITTVEIITCNSRHGTVGESKSLSDGTVEQSWVKSFTDQAKPALRKLGLTVKALPMGMGVGGANRWSILKWSPTTATWLYVTADGAKDTDAMWPGVHMVEHHPSFSSKNFVTSGTIVKSTDTMRKYTIDFGTIATLRNALVTLA